MPGGLPPGIFLWISFGKARELPLNHSRKEKLIIGLLALAVLAYKIYLAGVGMLAYQFARENLKDFFDGPFAVILCFIASVLIALIAMKANRMVIVILTAVVGGFAAVNVFIRLIPVFPADLSGFPGPNSPVYLFAKIFLSAAGVGVQDVREPD